MVSLIAKRFQEVRQEIPSDVCLCLAAKTRTSMEIMEALNAGATVLGMNYVQEANRLKQEVEGLWTGEKPFWSLIGHLQSNKVRSAVKIFDRIETVDKEETLAKIDKECQILGKKMEVFLEVNIGKEVEKSGVYPEKVEDLLRKSWKFSHLTVLGLMTMGPASLDPEALRPYFKKTKDLYEELRVLHQKNTGEDFTYLSMGMSDSYKVAIEEGSNYIRLGTKIFGERP